MKKWKGEAGKVRRRVLGAVDRRMKKRVGESDLGRVWDGLYPLMSRDWANARNPSRERDYNQAVLYAAALGVSLDDARARIAAQLEAVGDTFKPGRGYVTGA